MAEIFSRYKRSDMEKAAKQLINGDTTMEELTKDMKYYDYYRQAYGAVLDGMVGTFQAEIPIDEASQNPLASEQSSHENSDSQTTPDTVWVTKYGLKASSHWQKTSLTATLTISEFPAVMASSAAT